MEAVVVFTPSVHMGLTNPGGLSTSASIVKAKPTATKPPLGAVAGANGLVSNGDGVIAWGDGGASASSGLLLHFFGVGADTNTGLASVYAWDASINSNSAQDYHLYVPKLLASFSFELDSNMPGIANTIVPATDPVASAAIYWATTITLLVGNAGISVEAVSPGHGNDMAHVLIDTKGARWIEVRYGLNSSSTSVGGMYKRM